MQTKGIKNWLLFITLSLIWGSSFILMKKGLQAGLSAYQVAALRVFSAALVLLPVALKVVQRIPKNQLGYFALSGFCGSFIPAFLFVLAETKVDSSLAGALNALTPIFVIIIGALFFNSKTTMVKIIGVAIAVIGCGLLTFFGAQNNANNHGNASWLHILMVIVATLFYGLNVNLLSKYLKGFASLQVAAVSFMFLLLPALFILLATGVQKNLHNSAFLYGTLYACVLGVIGTSVATVLFFILLKSAGGLFASMVTYGIPFVAIGWGIYFGEVVLPTQIFALLVILTGVFIASKK
jgi:drug/metabolite transporter (DMT)-like permease